MINIYLFSLFFLFNVNAFVNGLYPRRTAVESNDADLDYFVFDPINGIADATEKETDPAVDYEDEFNDDSFQSANFNEMDQYEYEAMPEEEKPQQLTKRDMSRLTDMNTMSDEDVALALSKLSVRELQTLDKLIDNVDDIEEGGIKQKRAINEQNQASGGEDGREERKINKNCKKVNFKNHSDNERIQKRKVEPFYRHGRNQRLTADQRINAKINFLRDKYKRQSALKKLEDSVRSTRQEKRNIERQEYLAAMENPYFNSMLGPATQRRIKRSSSEKLLFKKQVQEAQSPEHIKLLEESFPNPASTNALEGAHIRVKRNTTQ